MADKKISALNSASTPLAGSEVLPIVQSGTTVKVSVDNLTAGKFVSAGSLGVNTSGLLGGAIAENRQNVDANYSDTFTTGTTRNHLVLRDLSDVGNYSTPFSALVFAAGDSGAAWSAIRNVRLSAQTSALTFATANGSSNPVERMRVDNAGNITASTGNLVVGTAGKGIDFSANTHAPGMTSELLTWYEEGTWTPTDGSGAALSFGNTANNCFYTRVGRMVICIFGLSYPVTADASAAALTGLPFISKSSASNVAGGYTTYTDAGFQIQLLVGNNDTSVTLWKNTGGSVSNAELSGKWLRGVITYFV